MPVDAVVSTTTSQITDLLSDTATTIAVVGATDDRTKYGAVIYRDLKAKGFEVVPVNTGRRTVDGDRAYARLADLPQPPDIVNIVVPPDQTLRVLRQARDLGLDHVWVQPGAEDDAVMAYLDDAGFTYLANSCIMVKSRQHDAG